MRRLVGWGFLILFLSVGVHGLSYEYLNNNTLLHFNNSYDNYYINLTSGIQLTNVYPDYWTRNIWCVWYNRAGISNEICTDKTNMGMTVTTDNVSYINISGSRDVVMGSGKNIRYLTFKLVYSLLNESQNLSILNIVTNTGTNNLSGLTGFRWFITDIKISNDTTNDFLYINKTYYPFSVPFNATFTNLSNKKLLLGDGVTGDTLFLAWNATNYSVMTNQKNESVNVSWGDLLAGERKDVFFSWLDAGCSWSNVLDSPLTNPNITLYQTFYLRSNFSASGLLCPDSGQSYAEYLNSSVWYNLSYGSGNLSLNSPDAFNPDVVGIPKTTTSWRLQGDKAGEYQVRVRVNFNGGNGFTSAMNVTVNGFVGGVDCPNYLALASGVTLSATNTSCFNITGNNVKLNCAGNKIVGLQSVNTPQIISVGKRNVSVVNCEFNNVSNGFGFVNTNVSNISNILFNKSFFNYGITFNSYGLNFTNVSRAIVNNVTMENVVVNTSADCSASDFIFLSWYNSNDVNVSTLVMRNSSIQCGASGLAGSLLKYNNVNNSVLNALSSNLSRKFVLNINLGTNISVTNFVMDKSYVSPALSLTNLLNFSLVNANFSGNGTSMTVTICKQCVFDTLYYVGDKNNGDGVNRFNSLNQTSIQNVNVSGLHNDWWLLSSGIANFDVNLTNFSMVNVLGNTLNSYFLWISGNKYIVNNVTMRNLTYNVSGNGVVAFDSLTNTSVANMYVLNSTPLPISFIGTDTNLTIANLTMINDSSPQLFNSGASGVMILDSVFNRSDYGFDSANKAFITNISFSVRMNVSNSTGSPVGANIMTYDRYKNLYNSFRADSLSSYQVFTEYRQWGSSAYNGTGNCTNTTTMDCYSPYNFTAYNTSHVGTSTINKTNASFMTMNISFDICRPTAGSWNLSSVCIIEDVNLLTSAVNFILANKGDLYLYNAVLLMKNMTFIGNYTLTNSSLIMVS